MDTALESRYREGLARLVFAACLLLFATCLGVLFLGLAPLDRPGSSAASSSSRASRSRSSALALPLMALA